MKCVKEQESMKKVNMDPFSSGTEHDMWAARNCDRCSIKDALLKKIRKRAIWNTIKVDGKEIRDIVTEIIEKL